LKVGTDFQCASAADGLRGDDAASGQWRIVTEQQLCTAWS
jgi:hypothetical protein